MSLQSWQIICKWRCSYKPCESYNKKKETLYVIGSTYPHVSHLIRHCFMVKWIDQPCIYFLSSLRWYTRASNCVFFWFLIGSTYLCFSFILSALNLMRQIKFLDCLLIHLIWLIRLHRNGYYRNFRDSSLVINQILSNYEIQHETHFWRSVKIYTWHTFHQYFKQRQLYHLTHLNDKTCMYATSFFGF